MIRSARAHPKRGTLVALAALLALSGLIRLGVGFEKAMALEASPKDQAEAATGTACAMTEGSEKILPVVTALKAREDRVAAREASLSDRLRALALTESTVDAKLAELRKAEDDLSKTLALADGAAEADLSRLTAVYENMKPKDAAPVFQQMKPEFAAGFLGRMKPDSAAAILAGLTPEKAYTVSVMLAGRNALAPKQ